MKQALQTCKTIEDFENLLNDLPKPTKLAANYGVIDAYGGAAYFELGNYKIEKIAPLLVKIEPDDLLREKIIKFLEKIQDYIKFR